MSFTLKEIDRMQSLHHGLVKLAAAELDATRMLRVSPEARRRLEPGPDGVRLLAIGCTEGRPYERPQDFRLAVQS